jgi:LysM repeat protein
VEPGDTLWKIAVDQYGGDPREAVWRIRERNGLDDPLIRPGQLLVLP